MAAFNPSDAPTTQNPLMARMFRPERALTFSRERSLKASARSAMRTVAGRGFAATSEERQAALVHLVAILQVLPIERTNRETSPLQIEVAGFIRRHRRRIARIGGLAPSAWGCAAFRPVRISTMLRRHQNIYLSSLDDPRIRYAVPVYSETEIECVVLMALWADSWFAESTSKSLVVANDFAPSCEQVANTLCWTSLPRELAPDRVEILKTLLDDGLRVPEALEIADRL